MSPVVHATDSSFDAEVVDAGMPVLVDFWAPWCGPCRMIGPAIETLASEYEGRIKVVKLNTQDHTGVATKLGIRSIPAVLLFDGTEVVDAIVGAVPKSTFNKMIDRYLKKSDKKKGKAEKRTQAVA